MLKIRLQRTGRTNNPSYRVIVGEHTNSAQSGKFLEILGSYDPKAGIVEIKADRVKHWIAKGAKASGTMHNFLVDKKIVDGKKINVLPKKTKQVMVEKIRYFLPLLKRSAFLPSQGAKNINPIEPIIYVALYHQSDSPLFTTSHFEK